MDLFTRRSQQSSGDEFLNLIADPFSTSIQQSSIYAAIVYSFVVTGLLFLVFCFLRPKNNRVYAPRAKHADEKHRPQPLANGPFDWIKAVTQTKEQELVDKIGLDAVLFMRFLRMIRNIFIALSVMGCAILIPVCIIGGGNFYDQYSNIATLMKFTPQYIGGSKFWAYVIFAYLVEITFCGFIWWNYKAVYKLRRTYFESAEYKASLHSRTLLLTHIPNSSRTDAGIAELVESGRQMDDVPRTVVGRNVKDLPELIEKHDETVRELEQHLAKYLSNPNQLPAKRPTCKVKKDDTTAYGKGRVDAIEYLTDRIARLEVSIKEVREGVDMRNPMSYGFASFARIEDAHAVAYATRKKGPRGCDVYLAPKPNDLLWQNLSMSRKTRRARAFWDGLWMVLLTVAFIVPNILTSAFLSNFANLGLVWRDFQTNLNAHPTGWAIVQGILAPLVQTLMYLGVPIVFRRLFTHSGDVSKTSRERHVASRLYAFYVFNNLVVFSVFGSVWRFVAAVIGAQDIGVWDAMKQGQPFTQLVTGLCNVSTFWLTWQMQRNLGAAIDLSQAWTFAWSWCRRTFFSPTPRELIELSAPPPFAYAEYYNNYLFVTTVGLCMGCLQPIIFPVTAFYVGMDVVFKKYLLQYVFITKTESGGRFWRLLVNRLLFAVFIGNAVIALAVGAKGVGNQNVFRNGTMLYAMVPLPFILLSFKLYCKKSYDDKLLYYSTIPFSDLENTPDANHPKARKTDKVGVRFGNPAIYKKLITPMVHAKSQHLLKEIYGHRSNADTHIFAASADRATPANLGYGDMYLTDMDHAAPGQRSSTDGAAMPNMEVVEEADLDFENFKRRAEFREEFGGDGALYGRPEDLVSRPGTPSTFTTFVENSPHLKRNSASPAGSRASSRTRFGEKERDQGEGHTYAKGYQHTPTTDMFQEQDMVDVDIPATPLDADEMLRASNSRQPLMDRSRDGSPAGGYFNRSMRDNTSYESYRGR
ncbi:DUF221-domain-containing protein [Didymella exigua CBS 183.55]|uniref:DUF221-domain-containing protein n=1 Tax=Didymella exigua CBS 183.55 TaxID=1150837 RepID=A0A6A5S3K9_9PLEO|nr:DUF221-domain-containing protein [Didymella exigua CBS 183.55]KAF1933928.1 DUF221-domain-containing protein [Didymella exigua CBS 183.55]